MITLWSINFNSDEMAFKALQYEKRMEILLEWQNGFAACHDKRAERVEVTSTFP